MADEALLRRLQENQIAVASRQRTAIRVGPFVALISEDTNSIWLNYAVPVARPFHSSAILELADVFREHSRAPRLEFLEALWPELPNALEAEGFRLQARVPLMICTADKFNPSPPLETVRRLSANDNLRDLTTVGDQAFGDKGPENWAESQRENVRAGRLRIACVYEDGQPAAAACLMPEGSVAELAGVGTVPLHRRKGFASAASCRLISEFFAEDPNALVWLTAGDAVAEAVYARIGFERIGDQTFYLRDAEE